MNVVDWKGAKNILIGGNGNFFFGMKNWDFYLIVWFCLKFFNIRPLTFFIPFSWISLNVESFYIIFQTKTQSKQTSNKTIEPLSTHQMIAKHITCLSTTPNALCLNKKLHLVTSVPLAFVYNFILMRIKYQISILVEKKSFLISRIVRLLWSLFYVFSHAIWELMSSFSSVSPDRVSQAHKLLKREFSLSNSTVF